MHNANDRSRQSRLELGQKSSLSKNPNSSFKTGGQKSSIFSEQKSPETNMRH